MPTWKLFSADDHVDLPYLPSDLWEKRVSAKHRDRAPRLIETGEGWHWEANGRVFGRPQKRSEITRATFGKSKTPVVQEPGRWRPTTPELRLADMDQDGVEGQVLFGGLIAGFQLENPELNSACIRAYNEWLSDFCRVAPERLLGLGFVPVHHVEAAVEELYNCARLGLKGVQFQPFDAYKHVWDEVWEPLWSGAEDTGLPIAFHIGAGTWSTNVENRPPGRGVTLINVSVLPAQLDEVLAGLVLCGALERHPKFKAVLAESSIGWIPYVLERMDREYRMRHMDATSLKMMPSAYYQRQIYATFQEDHAGMKLLELVGVDNILWASDYPHGDSVWPYSHQTIEKDFAGVEEAIVRKVTRDNVRNLFLGTG